jgi:GxxExxY protein
MADRSVTPEVDRIASEIVDAGFQVHKALGPGLLESAYEECVAHELLERGLSVRRQVAMPIAYRGVKLEAGYRIDLLINDCVVVEVKAIEALLPIHQAQVTYLRLSGCRLGFLMNFNVQMFKSGVRRIVI